MSESDAVYRWFETIDLAEEFIAGTVKFRSSNFYEALEFSGDSSIGDAHESMLCWSSVQGAGTLKSFCPTYLACFSNSTLWRNDGYWVKIISSEILYQLIVQTLKQDYEANDCMMLSSACFNVEYLDEVAIHKVYLAEVGDHRENSEIKNDLFEVYRIKRLQYQDQDEWRIVIGAADKQGKGIGTPMKIRSDSPLGTLLREVGYLDESLWNNYLEIKLYLGDISHIASICSIC